MSSSGKIILCLAVAFCVFQAVAARSRFDVSLFENVKYDLLKKCAGLENDFVKETANVRHKLAKESMKLMKKAVKAGSPECVESAKLQAEEELDEKSQEIQSCIQDLKDSIESELQPETELSKIMMFRSDIKNKLQLCKKSNKAELKTVQNDFLVAGKACLV